MYQIVEIKVKLNNLNMDPKDVEEIDDWDNHGDIISFQRMVVKLVKLSAAVNGSALLRKSPTNL